MGSPIGESPSTSPSSLKTVNNVSIAQRRFAAVVADPVRDRACVAQKNASLIGVVTSASSSTPAALRCRTQWIHVDRNFVNDESARP